MNMMKHIQTWILITLLALFANGVVSAKLASGHQNLSGNLHQSQTVLKALLHQGLEEVSTMNVSGSPLAPKGATQPKLKRIHSDQTLNSGSNKFDLESQCTRSTDDILDSLKPGSAEPLKVKPDGRIFDGDTRIKVLEERGVDIDNLPRIILDD